MKLNIIENHSAKAWSTTVITLGFIVDFLQRAAPQLQSMLPNIKWIAPAIMMLGGIWLAIQRFMDAIKQNAGV